jgi:arylsulfatase A-like enzyme
MVDGRQIMKCFWTFLFVLIPSTSFPSEKPNVVLILADDLGINDPACYGREDHHTPNLDQLARDGIRFTNAYAACPVCSPTRAALMTGLAPARLHLTTFLPGRSDCVAQKLLHPKIEQCLPTDVKTLPQYLKALGYATGCFGKWHLGGKGHLPTDHGFDFYFAGQAATKPSDTEGGKGEFGLTASAIHFIETNKDKPFFVYLAHNTPHIPYTAKAALVEKNRAAYEPSYAAVIESMDDSVRLLLKKLDELKLAKNTLVVFTSDNGGLHVPELNHRKITHNTPYRAGKGYLYEGGIRVPLIVRWSGKIKPGQIIETPVITTDWLPTILEFCHEKIPDGLDGASLAGLLTGSGKLADRPLFWHVPHYTNQGSRPAGAIRAANWKLIEHYEDGSLELFDLKNDIGEQTNLAAKEPDLAKSLHAKLAHWRKEVKAQENSLNPNFDPAKHKTLYSAIDPSKYNPLNCTAKEFEEMQQWRKRMDEVVPKK